VEAARRDRFLRLDNKEAKEIAELSVNRARGGQFSRPGGRGIAVRKCLRQGGTDRFSCRGGCGGGTGFSQSGREKRGWFSWWLRNPGKKGPVPIMKRDARFHDELENAALLALRESDRSIVRGKSTYGNGIG